MHTTYNDFFSWTTTMNQPQPQPQPQPQQPTVSIITASVPVSTIIQLPIVPAVQLAVQPIPPILNIQTHIPDGFVHVCDVSNTKSTTRAWKYVNIVEDVMFADHRSWVYALTINDRIVKIGESGNLLGYRTGSWQKHPQTGTKGRLSRYLTGDATDQDIRDSVEYYLVQGDKVSFWALKCNIIKSVIDICGKQHIMEYHPHKQLEMTYLDRIESETGQRPMLNKCRK